MNAASNEPNAPGREAKQGQVAVLRSADDLIRDMTAIRDAALAAAVKIGYRPGTRITARRGTKAFAIMSRASAVRHAAWLGRISASADDLIARGWTIDAIHDATRDDPRFMLLAARQTALVRTADGSSAFGRRLGEVHLKIA